MNPHLQHVASDCVLVVRLRNFNPHAPAPDFTGRARIVGWHCTDNPMWCEAELRFDLPVRHDARGDEQRTHRVYGSALATALVEVLA